MDPVTTAIVAALSAGAIGGVTEMSKTAITDTYQKLKELLITKFGAKSKIVTAVEDLEEEQESKGRQITLQEQIAKVKADQDLELLIKAKALLNAIQSHASDASAVIGLNLEDIKGASLSAERILTEGSHATSVKIKSADIKGGINFRDVTARSGEDTPPKKA
jgi:hypothetical protein